MGERQENLIQRKHADVFNLGLIFCGYGLCQKIVHVLILAAKKFLASRTTRSSLTEIRLNALFLNKHVTRYLDFPLL